MWAKHTKNSGFTIVELLIVIVVIGILAAITIVAYNGIQQNAKIAAVKGDLGQSSRLLEAYRFSKSATERYPLANDCSATPAADTICLKASNGNIINYSVDNSSSPPSFCITVSNASINFKVTNTSATPIAGTCSGVIAGGVACPSGFIVVPGNSAFGTSDFCVMKYEARQVGATTVPISTATGTPWVSVSQTNAIAYSANVAGCTGCKLMTENEWLTIAQNVLNVASNWTGGSVGSGSIYSGHNDGGPGSSLTADANDANGYSGTGNVASSNQRRTLTLSTGEVLWDLAGNVWEWTSGTIAGGQQPGFASDTVYGWKDYTHGSLVRRSLATNAYPAFGTPAASAWSGSGQGIGQLFSNYSEAGVRGFVRGGDWVGTPSNAGILSLGLNNASSVTASSIGFRVTK